jgi:hypothetical protein
MYAAQLVRYTLEGIKVAQNFNPHNKAEDKSYYFFCQGFISAAYTLGRITVKEYDLLMQELENGDFEK